MKLIHEKDEARWLAGRESWSRRSMNVELVGPADEQDSCDEEQAG